MRQGHHEDELFAAADRRGDLGACEKVVQSYGQEVLRTAYLLTDDRQRAWSMARTAFLELFKELPRLDVDVDLRARLLGHLGRTFLTPPAPDAGTQAPISVPLEGVAERFHVDDSRSRTRAALVLLDPPARLALVLRDLNALEVEQISLLLQQRPDVLPAALEASRRRVRGYIDLPPHEPLRATLTAAGFDAPSANLWPALADDAADMLRRAGSRSRMATTGVLVAVVAVLVIALVALFGGSPEESAVAEPLTNALNDPAPFPSFAPPVVGTSPARSVQMPSPLATGIVPDTLLMALEDAQASDGLADLSELRPGDSTPVRPVSESQQPTREEWPPLLSPDGRQLFITRYETGGSETRVILAAIDSTTFAENWQTELTTFPGSGSADGEPDVFVSLAVGSEQVYASLHSWQSGDPIRIMAFDLEHGRVETEWPVNMAGFTASDVHMIVPPGGDRLYLFAIMANGATIGGQMQLAFFGFQLPDGEQIHGKSLIEADGNRVFYLYQGNVTADGRSMYGLTHNGNSATLAVQFFDLSSATTQPPQPIRFRVEGSQLPIHEATSHDGRWLYVFSPLSAEVAIVDLQTRELLGIIPLDVQLDSGAGLAAAYPRDNTMQVSPDGSRLYAIGASTDGGSTTSGVWVIDTATWALTEHWLPESKPDRILLSGDGAMLYLHEQGSPMGAASEGMLWALDTATGSQVQTTELSSLPEAVEIQLQSLFSIYRQQYGRSPGLEDVQPEDNRAFTSLPAMEATMNPLSIRVGEPVTIDVRFIDPLSQEPLVEGRSDGRYQPSNGVRAVLTNSSGEAGDIILELGRAGYAEYRGTVVIPGPGDWTLSIVNDGSSPQTAGRLVTTNATVEVQRIPPGIGTGSFNVVPEGDPGYYSPAPPEP